MSSPTYNVMANVMFYVRPQILSMVITSEYNDKAIFLQGRVIAYIKMYKYFQKISNINVFCMFMPHIVTLLEAFLLIQ